MHFLENYYDYILKYDFINKFKYTNTKQIPKLTKLILNFGCKKINVKQLTASLLALEIISGKKGIFTQSKISNLILKIRKGNIVGCKLVIRKKLMYDFLSKFIFIILPKIKPNKNFFLCNKLKNINSSSLTVKNIMAFPELEANYHLFHVLPNLNITFLSSTKSKIEFVYLLNFFKLPFIFKK